MANIPSQSRFGTAPALERMPHLGVGGGARAHQLVSAGVAGRLLGTGVAVGLVAGAAWAAGRALGDRVSRDAADNPTLLNWDWATAIAAKMARSGDRLAALGTAERERAQARYSGLVGRAVELVADYTGIRLPAPLTRVHVFDRAEWVGANVAQFHSMFDSLDQAYATTIARARGAGPVGVMGQAVLSGQMGVLLGYLARRVLGQYDLSLLGREPVTEGRLYFVESNIAAMERHYHLPPDEFRAWIALHEVTHAFEFEAHPWVREHMNELLRGYLRSLSEDLFGGRAAGLLGTFAGRLKDNLFERGHLLELMMSREQRGVFRRLQALMALMEGYSNHVMDAVGSRRLKDHATLKQTFERRARSRGPAEQLFVKLTGLDIKLEQYALGERFCRHVVDTKGMAYMNRVWEGVERLPTLDEIREPERWIARQDQVAA